MSRTVVVTGGSQGIGWEIVKVFAQNGYQVVSGSRHKREFIPENIADNVKQIQMDVRNKEDHLRLVKTALDRTGQLDCYVNNAGYSEWRSLNAIDEEFLSNIFATNIFGYFWGAQAAQTALHEGASIINISSLAGKRGSANNSAYVATKFGVNGLTQSLCKELGASGIRVNAICPVLIETPGLLKALTAKQSPAKTGIKDFLNNFANNQAALNRLPTLDDVAQLCFFLASEKASGITGQSINIDCGVLPS